MKAHFHGGPWAGKAVELPVAFETMDVEATKETRVRYSLVRWVEGEAHYQVDGLRAAGAELAFPMPRSFPDV